MIHLITGGSGSGKSSYAEDWLIHKRRRPSSVPCVYIATMMPFGEDAAKKIERHQKLRAGKGFLTIERYTDLSGLFVPDNQGILLECMSNLAANELYRADGSQNDAEEVCDRILQGIHCLQRQTPCLAIVTNEVNSDINAYSRETEQYRELIGRINQRIGKIADRVTEIVYGIPVVIKE
ncbi:bifunctional adenosylcobinamide kinase/adenosylcobinamide-phosphate guanylyltransferase [Faecalicatena contorta]|uniref:bifunctional adenosylcobinamide kinase/adenosylcobinamide-phosphate guanylyltransferase n=1 Tax=Faecalicatena contorta TaxID=39482 RepID=UPI001F2BF29E|nr:bifunctional adenosylcobinamide kinase/adenosylcobinamide-phosphate guanylyltransferase [Faecalicatena contorta]MCF2682123.1 bifunctional adenosylcobinamide kinase/adenosylcobinamide-phosphate guanylyltransferase [Faecalicatena contorta]